MDKSVTQRGIDNRSIENLDSISTETATRVAFRDCLKPLTAPLATTVSEATIIIALF